MAESLGDAVLELRTDDRKFRRGIIAAERRAGGLASRFRRLGATVAKAVTVAGGAVAGITALAVKSASDFESSFAGVRKTVNATEGEFAALSAGMRELAREIPVSVNELNSIGEAAGQLGIETENILEFTEVMAQLGVTTNLSANEAATSLARLANIMQTPQDQFDELGSTIVELGNNFATTEAEIVNFATRMAGAAEVAGLAETDVLAIGAAMSSVGVEAERGGTAVQKVLLKMVEAVESGGDALTGFASTAGLAADQFAAAFREDAAGAFQAFVEGLGRQGTAATQTLTELELTDQRLISAFLSLAGAGDVLADSIGTASRAFEENTALTTEAEQRFETFASQMTLLKNAINDVLISVGQRLLPVFRRIAGQVRGYVNREGPAIAEAVGVFLVQALDKASTALGFFGQAWARTKQVVAGIGASIQAINVKQLEARIGILRKSIEVGVFEAQEAGMTTEEARDLLAGLESQLEQSQGTFEGWIDAMIDAGEESDQFSGLVEDMQGELEKWQRLIERGSGAASVFAGTTQDMTDAMAGSITKAMHPFESVIRSVGDGITTTEERLASLDPGLRSLVDGFSFATEKSREWTILMLNSTNPELRRLAIESIVAGEAVEEIGDKAEKSTGILGGMAGSLKDIGRGMGFIDDEGGFDFSGGLKGLGSGMIDQMGAMLTGGISSAISAGLNIVIGLIADAFGSDAIDFASKFKAELEGIGAVSDGLAEKMGEMANTLKDQGRELPFVVAKWAHLDEAIQETGVSGDNFNAVMAQVNEGMAHLAQGTITEAEAVETLEGVIPPLIDSLDEMDEAGRVAFRQMIEDTREAGLEIEALDRHIRNAASSIGEGVGQMLGAGIQGGGQAEFAATGLVTAFQELVAQGVSASEAFDILGPQIQDLQEQAIELGVTLPAPFARLSSIMDVLADEKIAKMQQRIDGMGQVMRGFLDLGIKPSVEQFGQLEGSINRAFNQLRDQGLSAEDAFLAMGDDMKLLARLQNEFGLEISDATREIFEQAGATQMLEDEGVTMQDTLENGIKDLISVLTQGFEGLGVTISDTFRDATDDAGEAATGIADHFRGIGDLDIPVGFDMDRDQIMDLLQQGPVAVPMDIPHLQRGGIVTAPTLAMVGESGPEAVVPLDRGSSGGVQKFRLHDSTGRFLAEFVAPHLDDAMKRLGGG